MATDTLQLNDEQKQALVDLTEKVLVLAVFGWVIWKHGD
jgi:hypothetical protein